MTLVYSHRSARVADQCPRCNVRKVSMGTKYAGSWGEEWEVLQCGNPECQGQLLAVWRSGEGDQPELRIVYPPQSSVGVESAVGQAIQDDLGEATICLSVECYKASMVMSRRALQRILGEQGCTERNLYDQIKHAVDKEILPKSMHSLAEEVRQYGNLSAHPDDDQLHNANRDSAEQILGFIAMLIHYFYELPAQAQSLKRNREDASSSN